MPGSQVNGKSVIKDFIESKKDIVRIVDVGAGSGTYPKLLGSKYEYVAIEIWKPYVEMFNLELYYDQIIIEDITKLRTWPKGDCIIFGDVLEHLDTEKGSRVLSKAVNDYKHVIVSIPVDGREGKIHYGNPHEQHLSSWTFDQLQYAAAWEVTSESGDIGVFCR